MRYYLTILFLLLLVAVDASGDAFRMSGWLPLSHSMESVLIIGFFLLWAKSGFKWQYILLYFLGRIWLFDIVHNLITHKGVLYMGMNDYMGRSVIWFADLVGQNYLNFSFVIKFMALFTWVGLSIKYSDERSY